MSQFCQKGKEIELAIKSTIETNNQVESRVNVELINSYMGAAEPDRGNSSTLCEDLFRISEIKCPMKYPPMKYPVVNTFSSLEKAINEKDYPTFCTILEGRRQILTECNIKYCEMPHCHEQHNYSIIDLLLKKENQDFCQLLFEEGILLEADISDEILLKSIDNRYDMLIFLILVIPAHRWINLRKLEIVDGIHFKLSVVELIGWNHISESDMEYIFKYFWSIGVRPDNFESEYNNQEYDPFLTFSIYGFPGLAKFCYSIGFTQGINSLDIQQQNCAAALLSRFKYCKNPEKLLKIRETFEFLVEKGVDLFHKDIYGYCANDYIKMYEYDTLFDINHIPSAPKGISDQEKSYAANYLTCDINFSNGELELNADRLKKLTTFINDVIIPGKYCKSLDKIMSVYNQYEKLVLSLDMSFKRKISSNLDMCCGSNHVFGYNTMFFQRHQSDY